MSASSFAHKFAAAAGRSPKKWLCAERIAEARMLLAQNMPIDRVASLTGYGNRYHFTQIFTKVEGLPPGRFQRLALRKQ